MYDFLDRPVTALDPGGRFLVWAMRHWSLAWRGGKCPAGAIAPAFAKWRMIAGLQPFHRAMLVLHGEAPHRIRPCAPHCPRVCESEALVLSLVCALRDRQLQALRGTLELLVDEDCVADAIDALAALGGAMDDAAIFPARALWQPGPAAGER